MCLFSPDRRTLDVVTNAGSFPDTNAPQSTYNSPSAARLCVEMVAGLQTSNAMRELTPRLVMINGAPLEKATGAKFPTMPRRTARLVVPSGKEQCVYHPYYCNILAYNAWSQCTSHPSHYLLAYYLPTMPCHISLTCTTLLQHHYTNNRNCLHFSPLHLHLQLNTEH